MATIENITTETRLVKHTFTQTERLEMGGELARAVGRVRQVEVEFEGIKGTYKAKIGEAESAVETISNNIQNGFEMRAKKCKVVFRPKDKKKDYYPEIKDGIYDTKPVLTDDMTPDDFNRDLFEAERVFEHRKELSLFKDGNLVVGRFDGKWYTALRITMGAQKLQERLDPAGKKFKDRHGAIKATAARCLTWITDQFGDETAKGFKDAIAKVVKDNEELVE